MFGIFKPQPAEVIEHWIAFVEGFQLSAQEFYQSLERELKERDVPGLEICRIEFAEGGLLSDKRSYLRLSRERLVFDVCAAPFGKSYFFSCRFAELSAEIKVWQLLFLLAASCLLVWMTWKIAGLILGTLLLVTATAFLIYTLRNAVAMGLRDFDALLVKSPLFGPLYERFLRKETYYRHDTRLMYLKLVSGVVRQLAENATAEKGIKLIAQYERAPVLGELYKPVPPEPETPRQ